MTAQESGDVTLHQGSAPTCSPLCNKFAGSSGDCVHHVSAGNLQNIRKVPLLSTVPLFKRRKLEPSAPNSSQCGTWPRGLCVRGSGAAAAGFLCRGQLLRCRPAATETRCPLLKPDLPPPAAPSTGQVSRWNGRTSAAPCRSSKEKEAAHAGGQSDGGRTLRLQTQLSGDTTGRTVCPLAGGDTSDL